MITSIKRIALLLLAATILAIVGQGCNTAHGFGKDMEKAGEKIDLQELQIHKQKFQQTQNYENSKLQSLVLELRDGLNENQRRIRLHAEIEIQEIQGRYKLLAVVLPVIPPLLLGLFVFTRRRLREREGISKARRLK